MLMPTGNQIEAQQQHKQWDARLHKDLSKNENEDENKLRKAEKSFLVFC